MAALTSQLIVTLIDRVSGPAKSISGALRNIQSAASGRFGGMQDRLAVIADQNRRAVARLQGQMLGAVGAAYSLQRALSSPISIASQFETAMLDIAQKADLSDQAIKALGQRIRALAPQINQTSASVAKGIDTLVGFGLDPERAEALIRPIGRAATAYRAEIDDLAKAGFAALDNLKLKAEDFGKALDAMAQSGKEGAFEIRDMATEFPSLTASAQALGMNGLSAVSRLSAALQIARKGAASGSEAATNTANLMQKIISPETTKKFSKLGVDIRKELKKTQQTGGDIFEMIAGQVDKALKGDLSKLGDLFEDMQVQKFLRPLIASLEEYRRIRDKALGADGIVDADFARRLLTNAAQTEAFMIRVKELGMTIGNILLPAMNGLMGTIAPLLTQFERLSEANPGIIGGIIKAVAALTALKVAAIAARFSFAFLKGGALVAAAGVFALTRGLLAVLNPLKWIAAGMAVAASATRLFSLALMGTGIGAALVALGAAATFIYKNWSGVGKFFETFSATLKKSLEGIDAGRFKFLTDAAEAIGQAWERLTGQISDDAWGSAGRNAAEGVASAIRSIADSIDAVITKWEQLKAIWTTITGIPGAVAEYVHGAPSAGPSDRRNRINERFSRRGNGVGMTPFDIGAPPIANTNGPHMAALAGEKTGEAYKQAIQGALNEVDPIIDAAVQRWIAKLSFSANPTITPNIGTPAGGGGNKGASLNSIAEKQHAAFADYGFNTV